MPSHLSSCTRWLLVLAVAGLVAAGFFGYRWVRENAGRSARVLAWLRDSEGHPEWALQAGETCGQAPFVFPTDGFVGYLWDDSFRPGHRHQGIDIFGGADVNTVAVVAAYPGYLTRQSDWKSSLIIRVPSDPLQPGRQIWTYYTHMADADGNSFIATEFPPGTAEVYVEAGHLLGYQGNYSGTPGNPVGTHLHFSIVLDDGNGKWQNELEIRSTLDPSPYLGLPLNGKANPDEVVTCQEDRRRRPSGSGFEIEWKEWICLSSPTKSS